MAKKSASVKFTHAVTVEARRPRFEPLGSLGSLDLEKLSKGSHKIEVGFFAGGCCSKLVRAVVKNGVVTGVEIEPCKDSKKPTKELAAILDAAAKALPGAGKKWEPVPLRMFVGNAAGLIDINGGCIQICIFNHCLTCCFSWDGWGCTTDIISIGPLEIR